MNRLSFALITAVALAGQAAICSAQQPVKKLSEGEAQDLATLLNIIETTSDYGLATKAYARAAAIDRNNVGLHEAQMRKMMKLGQPLAAYYPAKALNSLAPENALAWGITGYYESRKGNFDDALRNMLTSLEFDITNTSVLYNAGELVAWYEFETNQPRLSDRQKRIMDKLKENMHDLQEFSQGYEKAYADLKALSAVVQKLDELIADAEKRMERHRTNLKGIEDAVNNINSEIDDHEDNIKLLRKEYLNYLYDDDDDEDDYDHSHHHHDRENRIVRERIRDDIRDEENAISLLKRERNDLLREAKNVKSDLDNSRDEVSKLFSQRSEATRRVQDSLRWDPPTVDGVMTPEQKNLPRSTAKLPPMQRNPETEANARLRLAVAYIQNDMPEKAAGILHGIIENYNGTEAAKEAQKLLGGLPESKPKEESDS